jgi:hypothetical protein
MPLTKSYELIMSVCFYVRGKDLDARTTNPVLREFRELIEAYKLEKDGVKAWPITVDEFKYELIDSTWLTASFDIKFNIHNPTEKDNNEVRADLLRAMLKLQITHGTYSQKITIEMVDAVYRGDTKRGRWPREEIQIVGF